MRQRHVVIIFSIALACASARAQSDSTPPQLLAFDYSPTSVNVVTGDAVVHCTMRYTDSGSGVHDVSCGFHSPDGSRRPSCSVGAPSAGDRADGTWSCDVVVPRYSASGAFVADTYAYDAIGNQHWYHADELAALGFPSDLTVVSDPDVTAPQLTQLSFDPPSVDATTGDASVHCTVRYLDNQSGVANASCGFHSPTGSQAASCISGVPVSGNRADGTWECTLVILQSSEAGTWKVDTYAYDAIGNMHWYHADELGALGVPTNLQVQSTPDTIAPTLRGLAFPRFRGHYLKGGYDVPNAKTKFREKGTPGVLSRVQDRSCSPGLG